MDTAQLPKARPPEADLRRAILCERRGIIADGEITTDCGPAYCVAHMLGWSGMYATPLRTRHGWATPTRGDLGQGWPDLVLVSRRTRRVIFAELKRSDGDDPEPMQAAVMRALRLAGAECHVWRWRDLDDGTIVRIMQAG